MSNGRKPDYNLWMAEKDGHRRGRIGCAWWNSKGGLTIDLTPGVVIEWRDADRYFLTLWPASGGESKLDQSDLDSVEAPTSSTKGESPCL